MVVVVALLAFWVLQFFPVQNWSDGMQGTEHPWAMSGVPPAWGPPKQPHSFLTAQGTVPLTPC